MKSALDLVGQLFLKMMLEGNVCIGGQKNFRGESTMDDAAQLSLQLQYHNVNSNLRLFFHQTCITITIVKVTLAVSCQYLFSLELYIIHLRKTHL